MKKTLTAAVAAAASLALILTGCASGGSSGSGGSGGDNTSGTTTAGDLKIGNFLDVTDWDPTGTDPGFDEPYMSAVYDPLVRVDTDGQPTPALATKWEYNDDRTVLTMHLRDDVSFTDGEKFDADAAKVGLDHLRKGSHSADDLKNIKDVSVVDDNTIEITLSKRDDALLYFMGNGRSWMAAPKSIEADSLHDDPIGSGPYVLDTSASTPGSDYVFTTNDDYWNKDLFPWKSVEIRPYLDQKARQNAFDSGQTNVTYGEAAQVPLMKQKGKTVTTGVGQWIGIQFVDRTGSMVPALGDERVRKAITMTVDGTAVLKAIGEDQGVATNQIFRADGVINDKALNKKSKKDIAEAKKLMAEAGYADGFSMTLPMAPAFKPWQAVAEQGLKEIGITVKWEDLQQIDYQNSVSHYPMFIIVSKLEGSPQAMVKYQVSNDKWWNGLATEGVKAYPQVGKLLDTIQDTEGDAQLDAIRELNETLVDLAWYDVWYQGNNIFFSDPGITVTPQAGTMFPPLNFVQPTK